MAKYVAANLGLTPNPLQKAIDLTHQETPAVVSSTTRMGLAWHISDRSGTEIVWHNGQTGGYHSFVGLNLKAKFGVVILANSANAIEDIGYKILDGPLSSAAPTAIALPSAALDAVIGQYQLSPAASFSIKREGDRVFARLTGQSYLEIFPRSETEFFYKAVKAQISFTKDSSGKVTALTLHQNGIDQPATKVSDRSAAERKVVTLDPAALDACTGQYELAPGAIITVRRKGTGLEASLTGQPYFEIYAQSPTDFFYQVVDAQISFVKDAQGKATALILHQNGDQKAPRIK
jgi:hypothetical protein